MFESEDVYIGRIILLMDMVHTFLKLENIMKVSSLREINMDMVSSITKMEKYMRGIGRITLK